MRLNDDWLWEVAVSGRVWLERYADLGLDSETLRFERVDGTEDLHTVSHFTPGGVARHRGRRGRRRGQRGPPGPARDPALLPAGGAAVALAHRRGQYPVWMTYQGIAALRSWALSSTPE